jgi:hypothetical protein
MNALLAELESEIFQLVKLVLERKKMFCNLEAASFKSFSL